MSERLAGKVAVITGAASGIGRGCVERFVSEGARVVAVDIDAEAGRAAVDTLGDAAVFAAADVADEGDIAAAVDLAVSEFGRLECMFNNAGILGAIGPIADTSVEAWDRTIAVLLRSVFLGMKHGARVMVPQGGGVILSTASTAGVQGGLGPHAYTACDEARYVTGHTLVVDAGQTTNAGLTRFHSADPALVRERGKR